MTFRKTRKGYSYDYQCLDGINFERRYYRKKDVEECAKHFRWSSLDEQVHGEDITVAELLIEGNQVLPYRVVKL